MKPTLQAADALADAVRAVNIGPISWDNMSDGEQRTLDTLNEALAAYERAKAEEAPVTADWIYELAHEIRGYFDKPLFNAYEPLLEIIAKHAPGQEP